MTDENNRDDDLLDGKDDDLDAYVKERDAREPGFAELVAAAERRIEREKLSRSGHIAKANTTEASQH